jgi:ceramide glucosyltransferase
VIVNRILAVLACLSLILLLWQWLVAWRFPLHARARDQSFTPAVTLLKSLKGCDPATEDCLRSWFTQAYVGEIQILFGVVSEADPVCVLVKKLMQEFPQRDAQLVVARELPGANAKVSKLAELERLAKHEVLAISDADVRVPPDFLANAVAPLRDADVGLVNCFYRLANPTTLAMHWEAIAINADFWSQVLQSKTLKPLDFALGAAMVTRRRQLEEVGGFSALVDCLADDYQLGNRIAGRGHPIALCPVVVECWDPPMNWHAVWKHQLRWARTIRVSRPASYFFSILSNVTLWAWLWFLAALPGLTIHQVGAGHSLTGGYVIHLPLGVVLASAFGFIRIWLTQDLQRRLTRSSAHAGYFWLVPIKDLLQALIWLAAFGGSTIEWRGRRFKLRRDGTLVNDS